MVYTDPETVPRSLFLAAAAAAVLVAGAFLPWSVEPAGTFTGLHDAVRDGYLTFGVAIAVVAIAVVLEWDWIARTVAAAGGLGAVYVFSHWHGRLTGAGAADVGLGLWLTLVAGLGLIAAAAWGHFEAPAGDDATPEIRVGVQEDGDEPSA